MQDYNYIDCEAIENNFNMRSKTYKSSFENFK